MNNLISLLLDFFLPRHCTMCGQQLHTGECPVCIHCNMDLPRTFFWNDPYDNVLAKRFYGKGNIEKAAAYLFYFSHTATANIFYSFKYDNEPYAATQMGKMLAEELEPSGFFKDIDCLIPVPLNNRKKHKRGYNQSEKLALGISMVTGIEVVTNAIRRKKDTVSQTLLGKYERQENMNNVFERTIHAARLAGKHCMLIDDVITTGSTICACARELAAIPGIKTSIFALGCVKDIK